MGIYANGEQSRTIHVQHLKSRTTEGLVLGGEGKDIQQVEDMLAALRIHAGGF